MHILTTEQPLTKQKNVELRNQSGVILKYNNILLIQKARKKGQRSDV